MPDPLCPHCGHPLTRAQVGSLMGSLGGSGKSSRKAEHCRRIAKIAAAKRRAAKYKPGVAAPDPLPPLPPAL